jgi:methionyl-tRNA formyltransferase
MLMASWKDLYELMIQGESMYQIGQKMKLKPSRLRQMAQSQRLAEMLEMDERLALRTTLYMAATGATYAKKLGNDEGRVDWRRSAGELDRAVRALNPAPGVWFEHRGERIKLLAAEPADAAPGAVPGTVLDARLRIACGAGALRPLMLQRAGRAAQETATFLRGFALPPGTRLPCPATS